MALTYKTSGVDIKKADRFIKSIKTLGGANIGGFSGLFKLNLKRYKEPMLAASCDGVGTKLKIAFWLNKHRTVGIDLVAMNVNDLVTCGAEPIFFLDYISTTSFNLRDMQEVIRGIILGCREAGCILLGGETAQMPQFYKKDEYDLAGFALGVVDKKDIINGSRVKEGDLIIGLTSNGLHSNGYSLVRRLFSKNYIKRNQNLFYKPTRIYVKPILKLNSRIKIKGIAHITGGGFYDNIIRILPKGISVYIDKNSWPKQKVFKLIQEKGKISDKEMYRTFNMGIGMIVIIDKKDVEKTKDILSLFKIKSYIIGNCLKGKKTRIIIK